MSYGYPISPFAGCCNVYGIDQQLSIPGQERRLTRQVAPDPVDVFSAEKKVMMDANPMDEILEPEQEIPASSEDSGPHELNSEHLPQPEKKGWFGF